MVWSYKSNFDLFSRLKLRSIFAKAFYSIYLGTLRLAERIFGPSVVSCLVIFQTCFVCLRRSGDYGQMRKLRAALPSSWQKSTSGPVHFISMFYTWLISLAVSIFYDRLTSPRWRKRMVCTGDFSPATARSQPVIIVFLHAGAFPILRYWLRAQGLPAALYHVASTRLSRFTQKIRDRGDRAYGLQDIPHVFLRSGSLRSAVRFLKPGRLLLIALEERNFTKAQKAYPFGEAHICLNDLAFRLALLTDAVLLPVTVKLKGFCRFEIDFKEPVPSALINEGLDATNLYLARQFWPDIEENPRSMTWSTLEAIAPQAIGPRGLTP